MPESAASTTPPSLGLVAAVFLRIGNLTFGGGGPTIGALQRELVERRRWLRQDEFALSYALARLTPGTNLFAFCAAASWLMRGPVGMVLALLAASIPCSLLVALFTAGFATWSNQRWLQVAMEGALAASVGILLASFWSTVQPYLQVGGRLRAFVIVAGSILLSFGAGWSPLAVLTAAALVGWIWRDTT